MKLRGKQPNWVLIVGLVLLILGIYLAAFVTGTSGHLKVYFFVENSTVKILEASPEFNLPLAGIQPYVQNLTAGERTLSLTASSSGKLVLNQTYTGIGQGYDVRRTSPLNPSPASNANVTVTLRLFDKGVQVSGDQTITPWGRDSFWLIAGALALISGAFMLASNVRFSMKKRQNRRKQSGRTKREISTLFGPVVVPSSPLCSNGRSPVCC